MTDRAERRRRLPSASLNKAFDNIDRSRKDAIKIFCVECVGGGPGYRGTIRDCTDRGCPLYPWRPYKGKDDSAADIPEPEPEPEPEPKKKTKKTKKKCCDNPDVLKLKEGRRECKSCGKKWKLKRRTV